MSIKETDGARIRREMTAVLAQITATLVAANLSPRPRRSVDEAVVLAEEIYEKCQKSIRKNVMISEDRS